MRKKNILLAVLAISLTLSAGAGRAWAYFTTYAEAQGGYTLDLGDRTTIEEGEPSNWTKHVSIKSKDDSEPVYVRARAICGSQFQLLYSGSKKWVPNEDGFYYYTEILKGGQSTEILDIKIENIPEDVKNGDSFNVVVVYETTPVLYHEDGTAYDIMDPNTWGVKVKTNTMEGGA